MLEIISYFAEEDFEDNIDYIQRDAVIKGNNGEIVFQQEGVEFPEFWSDTAVRIVSDKYFRGVLGAPEREHSLKQLVNRVVDTITQWGIEQEYFDEENAKIFNQELKYLVINQYFAFNSPVWFNVGVKEHPELSACFIQGIEDSMESIMELSTSEAMVFKGGSGSGTNFSNLRSKKEHLSTGGKSSGPVSFMRGLDISAGTIKSGGSTRRAAKSALMNIDHLDIEEFITCKAAEEDKAQILIDNGYNASFEDEGGAYAQCFFQNQNNSVVVYDEFMNAVKEDNYYTLNPVFDKSIDPIVVKARHLFGLICEAAHRCGDPGLFFYDMVNKYHTCEKSGKVIAGNPCLHGNTLLQTDKGLIPIKDLDGKKFSIVDDKGRLRKAKAFCSGRKETVKVILSNGLELIVTPDHKLAVDGEEGKSGYIGHREELSFLEASKFKGKKPIRLSVNEVEFINKDNDILCIDALLLGYGLGDRTPERHQEDRINDLGTVIKVKHSARIFLRKDGDDDEVGEIFKRRYDDYHEVRDKNSSYFISSKEYNDLWNDYSIKGRVYERYISDSFLRSNSKVLASFLRGIFSANGSVLEKYRKVQLKTSSKKLAQQIVQCLALYGIRSSLSSNKAKKIKFHNGEYKCKKSYNVVVGNGYLSLFFKYIGFVQSSKTEKLRNILKVKSGGVRYKKVYVKEIKKHKKCKVYDFTVEHETSCGGAGGVLVHNCLEILDIDDSACNLGAFNLIRFISKNVDGFYFDTDAFIAGVRIAAIAQEIMIDKGKYPTKKITNNTHRHRQLGVGYCNLGALLMYCGLPYDSNEGRALAASISSLLTGSVYKTSCEVSSVKGSFKALRANKDCMRRVLVMHKENVNGKILTSLKDIQDIKDVCNDVWSDVIDLFDRHGVRNSRATALMPTGTVGFMMDVDTTGVEPELLLVKTKTLVGGGTENIVNKTVGQALINLGYNKKDITNITNYINENGGIDGCRDVKDEHIPIFDTSYNIVKGGRTISVDGHIKMVAAIQPHISGGISKTINMPNSCTVQDVWDAYMLAYDLGVKAISIYREGSKASQPLGTSKKAETKIDKDERIGLKRRMPETAGASRHSFEINQHKIYLHAGFFKDGALGEIFIRASKEGSSMNGFLDTIAVLTSLSLQYGVPLEALVNKLSYVSFEPQGWTPNKDIGYAKSIVDYIFRYLGRYIKIADKEEPEEIVEEKSSWEIARDDAPMCNKCGSIMTFNGRCYSCDSCGSTDSCG